MRVRLKNFMLRSLGRIPVPATLIGDPRPKLLFLSDTPSTLYGALPSLFEKVKPEIIIHGGDLADNFKLEKSPGLIDLYETKVKKLVRILEESGADEVILVLGNHDDEEVLRRLAAAPIFRIVESDRFTWHGIGVAVEHKPFDVGDTDLAFFGHNLERRTNTGGPNKQLNGIEAIYIIDSEGGITALRYPPGTNDERLRRRKGGI